MRILLYKYICIFIFIIIINYVVDCHVVDCVLKIVSLAKENILGLWINMPIKCD